MTDNNNDEINERGMNCLLKHLGEKETERFISTLLSEQFDYTRWRIEAFGDTTVRELNENADAYARESFQAERETTPNLKRVRADPFFD